MLKIPQSDTVMFEAKLGFLRNAFGSLMLVVRCSLLAPRNIFRSHVGPSVPARLGHPGVAFDMEGSDQVQATPAPLKRSRSRAHVPWQRGRSGSRGNVSGTGSKWLQCILGCIGPCFAISLSL